VLSAQNAECSRLTESRGMVIPCLVEYIDNVTDTDCLAFLKRMRTMVFSDYRLIYKFVDSCHDDLNKFQCGRLQQDTAEVMYVDSLTNSFFVNVNFLEVYSCKIKH